MPLEIGTVEEFAEGVPRTFSFDGAQVMVVKCQGVLRAVEDRCSHEDFPLSEGDVDTASCQVECIRHGAFFSLESGEALCLPATKPVKTYRVVQTGGVATLEEAK